MLLQGCLHALAEVFCSKAQEPQGGNSYEVGAELDKFGNASRIGRGIATRADEFATGSDFGNDLTHELPHCRATGIAHALSQVTRGNVQHVDPGHGQDRVEIVYRCRSLQS